MNRVLLLDPVDACIGDALRARGIEVADLAKASREEVLAALPSATAVVVRSRTRVDAEMIARAEQLRVIGRAGAGTDTIDVAAARARGIQVLTVPGGNDRAVAELAMAFMFTFSRQIVPAVLASREGEWAKSRLMGFELAGETLGIIGLGKIGRVLATMAAGLEMKVLGTDPYVDPRTWDTPRIEASNVEEILSRSRFVSVHVPMLPETRAMIGAAQLAMMRPDAYILNCSRGGIIDEDALADALEQGRLAGAGLDVFSNEPEIPARLRSNPRVLPTPHVGGSTVQAQEKIAALLGESLAAALS